MGEILLESGKRIGDDHPVYIIAEAGSNHNGSLNQAFTLIDIAADAGADAVKFQTFRADRLYAKSAGRSDYLGEEREINDIIAELEMPFDWIPQLAAHARECGIDFLSTPFDEKSADLLAKHVPLFKIASYEMTHIPLLRHVATFGKPMVVSTGTATLDEVRASVAAMTEAGIRDLVLMQCTASYPTPPEAANVRALVTLREATRFMTGLSDHTRDPLVAPMTATALGAVVIEKHFTISNLLPGPDHTYAIEPNELREMVRCIREVETVLGSGEKSVQEAELELRDFARRSLFTTQAVKKGQPFSLDFIAALRHGKRTPGLAPDQLERVLASKAAFDIKEDEAIREEMLA